ncbi:hypothetical protein JCGZ_15901 [Jatropha curcas]|uniref:Uncharacterized protein n=1 Tax=Jatropha curcas TaxID=180498 RepID=A0A067LBK3_JATCU|nr:hypothetical protein JCGZ_15901 [Jatropha curcas]
MNIVKGVADLIRRTASMSGESTSGSSAGRFPPPSPKICFSEVGDDAVLHALWTKYEDATDKVEKKKLFHAFLKQFLMVSKHWEPVNAGQLAESASLTVPSVEYQLQVDDIVVGCSAGHPAEVILILTEEITKLTSLVVDLNTTMAPSKKELPDTSTSLNLLSEELNALDALKIITRSLHNCRVFGYYGGIQKLTALMKGAVVQLKAFAGALSGEESLSNVIVEKMELLQQILVYVVSIICSFIDLNTNEYEKAQYSGSVEFSVSTWAASSMDSSSGLKIPTETRLYWHQKAVVLVMEAGGLNWLVELLRVIRRFTLKKQLMDVSLQYLTMRTLHLALSENPRGQSHFKSIGGLEVLLDGLGVPSINVLLLKNASYIDEKRRSCHIIACALVGKCDALLVEGAKLEEVDLGPHKGKLS